MSILKTLFFSFSFIIFFTSHAQPVNTQAPSSNPKKISQPSPKLVHVNVLDWGAYLNAIQVELENALLKQQIDVRFKYMKPLLSTATALSNSLEQKLSPDIVTPSIHFFSERPDLVKKLYPVPISSIPRIKNIPSSILEGAPRTSPTTISCIPILGGYMKLFYKKEIADSAPKNLTAFKDPRFHKAYAIPNNEPWFLGYLTYELLNTPLNERFTVSSLRSPAFRKQYKELVANAGLTYGEYHLDGPKFEKMKVIFGWGYKISANWTRAQLTVPLPFYMDCLGITSKAAADKNKLLVFTTLVNWFLQSNNQYRLPNNLMAFNMFQQRPEKKEFWRGLMPRELSELKALNAEALKSLQ